ncbi:medium chain dehydrogenase/reductase family protein [Patulibacter sp.]|uniref:medium chain dehydrogenase/reductase family protein n=1 Tax=Patulibacter sp. TaxID=1912859 RepID=UPI00272646B3|nr:medium chain dehydrogenase/reductase family protein [Patulibacter sp.]MDO9409575.1 medium chain dehydrogenase/reductase family protein [Patulibacter sp.]
MRTTQIELPAIGEPETLRVRERELPAPGDGEALVRVEATGVSFAEQQMRRGKYYDQPAFPFVPGYDLVGVVEQVGAGVPDVVPGDRVAALTKTGGWATHVLLQARDLAPVPEGLDPAAAETAVVNGLTAWRMLHRTAKVRAGDTVVVLGAAGGVGSLLVQLAIEAGATVVGVAGVRQLDRVRELGAIPVDHRTEDVASRVREIAPEGVAAVFDHVGGPGLVRSWRMLGRGGTLVSYGTAATKDLPGDPRLPVLRLLARLLLWNALPNGRRASFFDLWAGNRRHPDRYRREARADLSHVFALLRDGRLTAQIAAEFALEDAAAALRLAEGGGLTGKVLLRPAAAGGAG